MALVCRAGSAAGRAGGEDLAPLTRADGNAIGDRVPLQLIHWVFIRHLQCQSDGGAFNITIDTSQFPSVTNSDETVSVDTAVALAQKHMSARAYCCVSKLNAPSVAAVIAALIQLDD